MHLSKVDLPEPLRPRMPTVSPSRTVSDTSLSAQKSSVVLRRPPWMRRSFTVLYCPWASRKRLETLRTSTAKSLTQSSSAKLPSRRPKTARAIRKRMAERTSTARSSPTYQSIPFVGRT